MNLSPEEKRIRELLRGHKVEVDSSELWKNLDPHLREKKSRKIIVMWFMIGMMVLGLGHTWRLLNTSQVHMDKKVTSNHSDETGKSTKLNANSQNQEKIDVNIKKNSPLDHYEVSTYIEASNTESKTPSAELTVPEKTKMIARAEGENLIEKNLLEIPATWSEENHFLDLEIRSDKIPLQSNPIGEDENLAQSDSERIFKHDKGELTLLPTEIETGLIKDPESSAVIKPIHVKQRSNVSPRFYASLGAGMVQRSVEAKDAESREYATEVSSKERAIEHYSIEGGIEVDLSSKIYGRIGLSYSRLTNRISQNFSHTKDTILVDTSSIRIDPAGNSIYNTGNVQAKIVTTYTSRQHGYQHIFEIPVIIGLKLYETSSLNISMETGLFVNLGVSNSGAYLNEEGFVERINKTNNPYRSHIGVSPFVGVKARYNLWNGKELFVQPYWKKYGRSFTRDDFNLDIKNQTYGIQLGMQMNF